MTLPSERRPEPELPPNDDLPARDLPKQGSPHDELPPPLTPSPGDLEPPAATGGDATGRQPYTRIRAAWVGVWAGIVAVVLLIVFVAQNTAPVRISFLWMEGSMPTALALLIAGVGGAVIAMAVAAARIIQLRRTLRRSIT